MVDADESVRSAAHNLLERYGCIVETAHDGAEAICMVRNMALDGNYDVIIADIRLPDMTGYELLLKLQEIIDPVPLVLMTGFGYDPGHSIVKARQAGLPLYGVLYKPFRLDQLLDTVERIVRPWRRQGRLARAEQGRTGPAVTAGAMLRAVCRTPCLCDFFVPSCFAVPMIMLALSVAFVALALVGHAAFWVGLVNRWHATGFRRASRQDRHAASSTPA